MKKILASLTAILILVTAIPVYAATCTNVVWDGTNTFNSFGYTTNQIVASSFTLSSGCTVSAVGVYIGRASGYAFGAVPTIYDDNAGVPGSSLEAGSTIPNGSIPVHTSKAYATSTFAGTLNLSAGVTYWMAIAGSSVSAVDVGTSYIGPAGTSKTFNGAIWVDSGQQFNSVYTIDGTITAASTAVTPRQNRVWMY
jgi:hypothetical protein